MPVPGGERPSQPPSECQARSTSKAARRSNSGSLSRTPRCTWATPSSDRRRRAASLGRTFLTLSPEGTRRFLEILARDFAESGYDVQRLFRVIMATELYQLPSAPRRGPEDPPMQHNVAQRLRADQVFDNLLLVLEASEPAAAGAGMGPIGRFARGPRQQFTGTFGYDPSVRRDEVQTSIPQALTLMNNIAYQTTLRADQLPDNLATLRDEMDQMFERFWTNPLAALETKDRWFGDFRTGEFLPKLDVTDDASFLKVTMETPGVEMKDLDIEVQDGVLSVSGEKKQEETTKDEGCYRTERSYGFFRRAIPLPAEVDANKAEARLDKGVLTIKLPKTEAAKKQSVKVAVKS